MKNIEKKSKMELEIIPKVESPAGIENHKNAATDFEAIAKNHPEEVKNQDGANYQKPEKIGVKTNSYLSITKEALKENVKSNTSKS